MPKGVYTLCNNVGGRGQAWPDDVIETMKQAIANGASAGEVVGTLRRQHNYVTTRNSVLGKAYRIGCRFKGKMHNGDAIKRTNKARVESRRALPKPPKQSRRMKLPKVVEPVSLLREEGNVRSPVAQYKRLSKQEDIERARIGFIPAVIEAAPTTTKPFGDLKRGECRWPTVDDASHACGATATVGAYCDKHAVIAYRTMPTRKRNASFAKVQDIDRGRKNVLDAEAEETVRHFLEAPRMIGLGTYKGPGSGFEQPLIEAFMEEVIDD
jgi:hypothetical protein